MLADLLNRWKARHLRREFRQRRASGTHAVIPGGVCLLCGQKYPTGPCPGEWKESVT